ncbi:ADP-ribose pyrophosphatase [Rubrobacter xylanophilus DSM 9941]|uniref:NUDIX hydrolase n=1 Tax=Rubrobacter xylanophilus TaxID=49319 RepID=UPI001C63CE88|nr:NUDIX hydrolase [Rubrobacter xylanophilus]QYJ15810.1 ADP-ribose pyrophosphatase [Rubrobacter xylanophilus DSM 9941]
MPPEEPASRRWEVLSSERLLETPYFALRTERLRLPDGEVKDPYYVLERPDAVFAFPLTRDGQVVLVRQYRPPLRRMELCIPAGLVEPGEPPEAAARRELLEETGYGGGEWEYMLRLASSPGLKNNWAYLFLARGVEPLAPPDPDEHERLELVLAPPEKLMGMVSSGEIVSATGAAAIMLALGRLRQ